MKPHLVLARFGEDVTWADQLRDAYDIYVYDMKGDDLRPKVIPLPNLGQEPAAYLAHIVQWYTNLPEFVIFSQANPAPHTCVTDFVASAQACIVSPPDGYRAISQLGYSGPADHIARRVHLHHKKNPEFFYTSQPLDDACKFMFGKPCPPVLEHTWGAIFAVSRKSIQCRTRAWYERIQRWSVHAPKTFEAALLEKLWQLAFTGY